MNLYFPRCTLPDDTHPPTPPAKAWAVTDDNDYCSQYSSLIEGLNKNGK